jgi:hypothetical protein
MRESGTKQERISIAYFEGVNSTVQHVIARKTELAHMENARAPMIGVLEKREGQAVIGTAVGGGVFATLGNFGLSYWLDGGTESEGLIRVTTENGVSANIYFLHTNQEWKMLTNPLAQSLSLSTCNFAQADGHLVVVNGTDANRMLLGPIASSTTTITSSVVAGSLYNSPIAKKVAFYKSRLYLANYIDGGGNRLNSTVLRSSYPMGLCPF